MLGTSAFSARTEISVTTPVRTWNYRAMPTFHNSFVPCRRRVTAFLTSLGEASGDHACIRRGFLRGTTRVKLYNRLCTYYK